MSSTTAKRLSVVKDAPGFVIEKGIPLPKSRSGRTHGEFHAALHKMEVGDSVLVPGGQSNAWSRFRYVTAPNAVPITNTNTNAARVSGALPATPNPRTIFTRSMNDV